MENSYTNIKHRGRVYFLNPESEYLSTIAKDLGYDTKTVASAFDENLLNDILKSQPDFLVANAEFNNFTYFLKTLANIKALLQNVVIIVTGDPFLTYNTNVTYENPYINYVIIGEAEYSLKEILDGVQNNEILGICYNDENMLAIKNEIRPPIQNLDELPMPTEHYIHNNTITIEVSRGCPYQCSFCLASIKNGFTVRSRTPDNILKEIEFCIKKYNTKNIYFKSDIFNFDNNWVQNLCNTIINNNISINWSCDLIPKNLDNELAKLMKKSGCQLCKIGTESGDEEILKNIEKGITVESIKKTVEILKNNNINVESYYLIGLPWETEETCQNTIKLIKQLKCNKNSINIPIPYPGTKFFVYSMLNKLFTTSFAHTDYNSIPYVKTHKLSKDKVINMQKSAYYQINHPIKYYFNNKLKNLTSILDKVKQSNIIKNLFPE